MIIVVWKLFFTPPHVVESYAYKQHCAEAVIFGGYYFLRVSRKAKPARLSMISLDNSLIGEAYVRPFSNRLARTQPTEAKRVSLKSVSFVECEDARTCGWGMHGNIASRGPYTPGVVSVLVSHSTTPHKIPCSRTPTQKPLLTAERIGVINRRSNIHKFCPVTNTQDQTISRIIYKISQFTD